MRVVTVILLVLCAACGTSDPPDTSLNNGLDDPFNGTTGLELAERDFGPDPYAIGRDWYIYDGPTHALYPEEWVYVIRGDEEIYLVEIDSYYNDVGDSGYFTLSSLAFDGESWGERQTFVAEKSVKEENVCVSVTPFSEVACSSSEAVLVLRTAWRAVPAGGLVVSEPAIFNLAHFSRPSIRTVAVIETASIDDIEQDAEALRALDTVPSSANDPRHSRVGWLHDDAGELPRTDIQLHVTSNLHMAQWQVESITQSTDTLTVDFRADCQRLSLDEQPPFSSTEGEPFSVELPTTESFSGALVQICDSESEDVVSGTTVDSFTTPVVGLWPDSKTFDLIVEQLEGRISVRIAPGHLLWNWTRGSDDGTDEFSPIDLDTVWAEKLGG